MKAGKPDVYDAINVLIKRKGRENNFKPVLESIQELTQADVPMPLWLQEVFLGYGDPAGANYTRLPSRPKSLDFRDTFIDWQHLLGSFPGIVSFFSPCPALTLANEVTDPAAKRWYLGRM